MPKSEAFNMDCLEYMKSLPDNAFDLLIADPPYGDGCSQIFQVERERERERDDPVMHKAGTSDSRTERGESPSGVKWNRFGQRFDRYKTQLLCQPGGWHGKDKYHLGRLTDQQEPAEPGPKNTGKKS